jgi:hypothetical protein
MNSAMIFPVLRFKLYCPLLIAMIIFCSCSSNGRNEIGMNERIHHDDFEYSVTGYDTTVSLGSGLRKCPDSQFFYLVHFRVENNAGRVNHRWDNSIAFITDENGNRYENDTTLQKILDSGLHFGWEKQYITPAHHTDTTILVFTLPESVRSPFLRVRGSILMGDVFDRGKFLRTKIRLY